MTLFGDVGCCWTTLATVGWVALTCGNAARRRVIRTFAVPGRGTPLRRAPVHALLLRQAMDVASHTGRAPKMERKRVASCNMGHLLGDEWIASSHIRSDRVDRLTR